jgi:hypothetical protein
MYDRSFYNASHKCGEIMFLTEKIGFFLISVGAVIPGETVQTVLGIDRHTSKYIMNVCMYVHIAKHMA